MSAATQRRGAGLLVLLLGAGVFLNYVDRGAIGIAAPLMTSELKLDPKALAGLPVALARRVVREAARQAGEPVPAAAATDRFLALPAD